MADFVRMGRMVLKTKKTQRTPFDILDMGIYF